MDAGSGNFDRPDCLVNGVDGLSSFQQFNGTNADFFPPGTELVGEYEQRVQIRDREGNGWDVSVPFSVVNEVAGDVMLDGVLDTTDIDIISSAIRQSLTDSKYDINQDAQVNKDDRTIWVHDLANTYFGDSNLDGEFNSGDLTVVFQVGEYEDNITLNSTWAEGDWNGDGDFESGDLVAAFQDGGFEKGPRAAVNAVPEPSSVVLLLLGIVGMFNRGRRANRTGSC